MKKSYYDELRARNAKEKKYVIGDVWLEYYYNGPRKIVNERDLAKIYTFTEAVQFLEKYDVDGILRPSTIDWEDRNDGLDGLYDAFPDSKSVIYDNDASYEAIFYEVLSQQVKNLKQVKEKAQKAFAKKFHLS